MSEKQIVEYLGGSRVFGKKPLSRLRVVDVLAKGLPFRSFECVEEETGLAPDEMAAIIGVSTKTLGRWRHAPTRRLFPVTSGRLYRVAEIYAAAAEVLEGEEAALEWLRVAQVGLGMRVPLELMETEVGAQEVGNLLGRIRYGILS